jgi:hypothetical protein
MHEVIDRLGGELIVSCQAYPSEPMRDPNTMRQIAQSCVDGGAAAIRAQGIDDIAAIVERVNVSVIGLWKDGAEKVCSSPQRWSTRWRLPGPAPTSSPSTARSVPVRTATHLPRWSSI